MNKEILYLLGEFPLPSETFIFREIEIVSRLLPVRIVAFRRAYHFPDDPENILAKTQFPPSINQMLMICITYFLTKPAQFLSILRAILRYPHRNMNQRKKLLQRFPQLLWLHGILLKKRPAHVHAHYLNWITEAAMIMSDLFKLSFSASGHANDIYVYNNDLIGKIRKASFVTTCTAYNLNYLRSLAPDSSNLYLNYHGLSENTIRSLGESSHRTNADTKIIISVGRLVEKKGFEHLIEACQILRNQGYDFRCQIIGEGPLQKALKRKIRQMNLDSTIELLGALPNKETLTKLTTAHIFVLASIQAKNSDIDGIPNVIIEAMFARLPVVSTKISGIPEVVQDQETGLLSPQKDPISLASKIEMLLTNPDLCRRLADNAFHLVETKFNLKKNVEQLSRIMTEHIE